MDDHEFGSGYDSKHDALFYFQSALFDFARAVHEYEFHLGKLITALARADTDVDGLNALSLKVALEKHKARKALDACDSLRPHLWAFESNANEDAVEKQAQDEFKEHHLRFTSLNHSEFEASLSYIKVGPSEKKPQASVRLPSVFTEEEVRAALVEEERRIMEAK